jgi:hypothetical protein
MDKSDRSFTVEKSEVSLPSDSPRFISKTPSGAAAKIARRMFAALKGKNKGKEELRFTIRETTQGTSGKLYRYIGIREKLAQPKVTVIAGKEIVRTHSYKVKSCRL